MPSCAPLGKGGSKVECLFLFTRLSMILMTLGPGSAASQILSLISVGNRLNNVNMGLPVGILISPCCSKLSKLLWDGVVEEALRSKDGEWQEKRVTMDRSRSYVLCAIYRTWGAKSLPDEHAKLKEASWSVVQLEKWTSELKMAVLLPSAARQKEALKSDLVIPSVDKYLGAESETDHRILEVDLTAISDFDPLHNADSDTADGDGFGSGTTLTSDRVVADHQDNDNDSGIIDGARLQLAADIPMSASPGHRSLAHQASPIWVNTETTQGSASYVDRGIAARGHRGNSLFGVAGIDSSTCSRSSSLHNTLFVGSCESNVSGRDGVLFPEDQRKERRGRAEPHTPQTASQSILRNHAPERAASYIPNDIQVTSSCPPSEIGRLLARPASSLAEDPRDLVHVQLPANCPVCFNLDPYEAPPDGSSETSWAKAEYNITDDRPVGMITNNSDQLLKAAQGGCFYCGIVTSALGAVHPSWTTEKTFVHIFLATGLPVVVRLQFGWRDSVVGDPPSRSSGPDDLWGGRKMEYTIMCLDESKPPIEIEIYRPVIPDDQLTVGDIALAPLVQNVGFAEETSGHVWTRECFDFIKDNLECCIKQHKCSKDGESPLLPDLVIWIEANNASDIQLLEPKNVRAPFIALSYCWGPLDSTTYLTNVQNC
ncbi:hypothetical protein B0O99DRAFT_601584 [Bisporella sp. PMI_857]|nr:hypothetical protein B0O99DRAFT_601584 [Bisporella sp. PMI_857]